MIIRIDQSSEEPLYLQIHAQIVEAIATGVLVPGDALPSVRTLAQDLGINLHTVNKAYAVLRDEGYLIMKGRQGASVASPFSRETGDKTRSQIRKLEGDMRSLVLTAKAHGVSKQEFLTLASQQAEEVF